MTENILRVRDVTRRFGDTVALSRASLEVETGSFVALLGPSGCGKSTLFNVIAGLQTADEGSVTLKGVDVAGRTGHVGYMLQKDLLVPWRTVEDNILLAAHLTRGVQPMDRVAAREMATRYGLGEFLRHYPHALSGGMRQRVAFMRTLATHQSLLLLDEPFGALDAQTRFEMQRWLLEVWESAQRTVLFVTHDVDEALFLADRVVVMSPRPGRIVADLSVTYGRPRTLDTLTSPEFMRLKAEVLSLLHPEATR